MLTTAKTTKEIFADSN